MSTQKKEKENNDRPVVNDFVVEFRKYTTELNQKFLDRKPYSPPDESKLLSFIPGTITKLLVSEGDHVDEGSPLLVLEAMKMKNRVFASRPGIIRKIHISQGMQVPKAMVMMEFDLL